MKVLIYSHAAKGWWRENGHGYTDDIRLAGEFDVADALSRIGSGFDWRCGQKAKQTPADSIVPVTRKHYIEAKPCTPPAG